ncbi:unnamed protein product [Pleuronectes platessa]|uniref:Uncharacterized protein n=1 Tax=Pleuronectes platessa TaxID=8262 RepID=A0A9N7TSU1_PLEPL|nr:unnamed protein product [Pleuronectes platessa]
MGEHLETLANENPFQQEETLSRTWLWVGTICLGWLDQVLPERLTNTPLDPTWHFSCEIPCSEIPPENIWEVQEPKSNEKDKRDLKFESSEGPDPSDRPTEETARWVGHLQKLMAPQSQPRVEPAEKFKMCQNKASLRAGNIGAHRGFRPPLLLDSPTSFHPAPSLHPHPPPPPHYPLSLSSLLNLLPEPKK